MNLPLPSQAYSSTQLIPDLAVTAINLSLLQLDGKCKTYISAKGEISLYVLQQGTAWLELETGDVWECEQGTIVAMSKSVRHTWATTSDRCAPKIHSHTAQNALNSGSAERGNRSDTENAEFARFFTITVPDTTNTLPDVIPNVFVVRPQERESCPGLWPTLQLVMRADLRQFDRNNYLLQRYVEAIAMILTLHGLQNSKVDKTDTESGLNDPRIRGVLCAIHEDISQQWSLDKMARIASMSKTGFVERFKALLGTTPQNYLLQLRMRRSTFLLRSGTTPICQISEMAGYRSESSFCKAFLKKVGYTPGKYRDLVRRGEIKDFVC